MALQAVYKQFLAAPNSSALAQNASLHYITTLTSFYGPTDIIKHLSSTRNQINKHKEELINVVEGQNALAVQAELTLEFQDTGGPYLPGLDDQFLSDRTVHLPVFHIVKFDSDGQITTIQQSWDQGALLKQLDVIGKTGRNWPIRDGPEQIKLIARTAGKPAEPTAADLASRTRTNSSGTLRDARHRDEPVPAVVSPYAGTRPRQRTFEEILGDEHHDFEAPDREKSPSKVVAPKIGAGKNFQPSRLFDKPEDAPPEPDSPEDGKSPERFMRPHPKKYNHFDFADGSDPSDAPKAGIAMDSVKGKHRSQWDFEDFVTPQKAKPSKTLRNQEIRHWGTGTDKDDIVESPAKAAGKPRRDAEKHFEMEDDGNPPTEPRVAPRPRGTTHNSGLGLYKNHMTTDDGSDPVQSPEPRALGNITNLKDRSKTFAAHFDMNDNSPTQEGTRFTAPHKENNKPVKENGPEHRIKLGGDGMGNPKGGRGWSLGDDSDEERQPAAIPGRKGAAQKAANSFWDH
ncbi:hypothetical protein N8I77_004608 [Diaporthe amygdali]|uniref:NTF2-like protein n=1 Tax=Phomopsis amygdali TaxID=1214568 RepID=A0AAD9SL97_PHOAM|nr:hypothetical protein N8I77_004608 [Diaporthe amygdali]